MPSIIIDMDFHFIGDTKVGAFDNLIEDKQKLDDLRDLFLWALEKDVIFNDVDNDDFSLNRDIPEEEKTRHREERRGKTLIVEHYPPYYQRIMAEINKAVNVAFEEYLVHYGAPGAEFREIEIENINNHNTGNRIDPHLDPLDFGVAFYLAVSDDYSGGELRLDKEKIDIPVVLNRVIFIPNDVSHSVNEVTGTYRFSLTTFVPVGEGSKEWDDSSYPIPRRHPLGAEK